MQNTDKYRQRTVISDQNERKKIKHVELRGGKGKRKLVKPNWDGSKKYGE